MDLGSKSLAILGASSPFVVDLLQRLVPLGPWRLRLHGRDRVALAAVSAFARHVTLGSGGSVEETDDLARALDGADLVVHQIRYGGLEGRALDEQLAASVGLAADETLGPAGLHAAIRMSPALLDLARALRRCCPDAWVLNLTNPLSLSTALLTRAGVRRAIGLCELPSATLSSACAALDVDPAEVNWQYSGFNHRGFIHRLGVGDRDLVAELSARLGDRSIGGITGDEIASLGALPLKYFRLFLDPPGPRHVGRAAVVAALREKAVEELRRDPDRRPPTLDRRAMPWYGDAVIPMIRALRFGDAAAQVVNVTGADGLAREFRATVESQGLVALPTQPPGGAVAQWIDRFEGHERASLRAALNPGRDAVRAALEADPMLPPDRVAAAMDAVLGARTRRPEPVDA